MPLLTIVTVCFNAERTIVDTMRSVAAQDFDGYEHLIIDGGSKDRSVALARAWATERTRIWSEPDEGLYDAMNKGIARATGTYIGFLNADDFFVRKDALSILAQHLDQGSPAVSASVVIVKETDPDTWVRSYSSLGFKPWMLRFGHMPPHPGFYARRDIFKEIGGFDTRFRIAADFDWMIRLHQGPYQLKAIPETLVALREGGASNSGFSSRRRIAREAVEALRKNRMVSMPLLMWAKYLAKAGQYVIPPLEYPAPSAVAYFPQDHK